MQYGETGQHSDEVGHNVDSHALVGSYDIERLLATDGDIYGAYDAAAKYRLAPSQFLPARSFRAPRQDGDVIFALRLSAVSARFLH